MIHPVILSGGSGSRLWPLSRTAYPKQLLALTSERSLLQETLLRLQGLPDLAKPLMVCNHEHRFLVAEQMREIDIAPQVLMLEPIGRNTAPAIAVAALYLAERDPQALMLVLASDHVIAKVEAFHECAAQAIEVAKSGHLVTFGIVPSAPETGYGYIQRGEQLNDNGAYQVARFVEKPDTPTAQQYLESGDYLWNSGMFVFPVQKLLDELEKFHPEILAHCRESLTKAYSDLDFYRLHEESFAACPSLSIDYALMEKTKHAAVVPSDIGWSDVGSWSALWEHQPKDQNGNVARGETFLHESRNCYVNADRRFVAAVGVENLIIAETADAVLVAHKDHAQDVKKVVEWLQKEKRGEHQTHRHVYRPWGSYEGVERGERFQVKRIIVKPGEKLSLQMHHHRAEHWIVVSGTAEVTVNDEVSLVSENESVYIPLGAMHRLHNPGRIPLHLIEVQSGPYLGEDDIVRVEDIYGRMKAEG
jgi:mannose-1-phosphate guanylyltransferase/mannose-1-phosphate guanylyltransferase/mannose-6-phosphate isomerase